MKSISLQRLRLVTSASAGLGVCLGLYGALKAENLNLKSFSLLAATSSVIAGMASYGTLILGEDVANRQIGDVIADHKEAVDTAKRLKEDNGKLSVSHKSLEEKYEELIVKWNDLKGTADTLEGKAQNQVQLAKRYLKEHLNSIRDRLNSVIQTGIRQNNQDTRIAEEQKQHINKTLAKRLANLEADLKKWQDWIKDITSEDFLETSIQILDEITTHKSKIAATSTRLNYHNYVPKDFLHKENALKLNEDYHSTVLEKINEYDEVAANNEEFMLAAGRDIELLKARLAQQNAMVQELSQPLVWKFALNHATRAGNLIIEYCQSNGIHLDRSHYSGDAYEVDLYFFTDRLNAAQTVDVRALNESGEKLAQIAHCQERIRFSYEYETRLLVAHAVLQQRVVEKKQPNDPVEAVKQLIKPVETLLPFVKDAYHVGVWSSTGGGKTTCISNVIGSMAQELGGMPTIRLTIPKIDADTQPIFPEIHWLGIPESIFGLLEAALEIQYRIQVNEKAFRAKEIIRDFDPIIFFIDEINAIFTRWGAINDADLENVLDRFETTLKGERLDYFRQTMRIELTNYKNQFAKKLLLFIWQTGRSLRVKSLIAGQNLQPGSFGLKINDLANCSYISIGQSIKSCSKYKVKEGDIDLISKQYELLQKAQEIESNLQYTALYCPSVGKSFFGILPPPNHYKWEPNLLNPGEANATPAHQTTATHANRLKIAETQLTQALDPAVPQKQAQNTPQRTLEASNTKACEIFKQRALIAEKYQNLDFRGYADLLASLPKKADGTVNKVQAYESVFKVWKSDVRKIYSAFIDWLEANFKE